MRTILDYFIELDKNTFWITVLCVSLIFGYSVSFFAYHLYRRFKESRGEETDAIGSYLEFHSDTEKNKIKEGILKKIILLKHILLIIAIISIIILFQQFGFFSV